MEPHPAGGSWDKENRMMKPRRITWPTGEDELTAITGIHSKEYRAHLTAGLLREDWQGYEELRVSDAETAYQMRRSGVPSDLETVPLEGSNPTVRVSPETAKGLDQNGEGFANLVHASATYSSHILLIKESPLHGSEGDGSLYTVPNASPDSYVALPLLLAQLLRYPADRLFMVLAWHARLKGSRRLQVKRRHFELADIGDRSHRARILKDLEGRGLIRVHRRGRQMPEVELASGPKGMPGRWPRIVTEKGGADGN